MKTYSLEDMLRLRGINLPIKKTYSENEYLGQKPNLSSGYSGACMIYDRVPYETKRWLNARLRKHNMAWVQGNSGWAKIVRLDDSKPLPENYYEIGEALVCSDELYEKEGKWIEQGRISKDWYGGVTFQVKD